MQEDLKSENFKSCVIELPDDRLSDIRHVVWHLCKKQIFIENTDINAIRKK